MLRVIKPFEVPIKINELAFSPDGRFLASADEDRNVLLFNAESGDLVRTFYGHNRSVLGLAFCPSGSRLASSSKDRTVRIWDIESGNEIFKFRTHYWMRCIEFGDDGSQLFAGSEKAVQVWDAATSSNSLTLEGHVKKVNKMQFSPDDRQLITVSADRDASIWDLTTGERRSLRHQREVLDVAIHPTKPELITSCRDGKIRLWDRLGAEEMSPSAHARTVFFDTVDKMVNALSVAYSPNGKLMGRGANDGTATIWNIEKEVSGTVYHGGEIRCVAFCPDSKLFATGSTTGTINLWDTTTYQLVATLGGRGSAHTSEIFSVRFSAVGGILASAAKDDTIRLWDVSSGALLGQPIKPKSGDIYDLAISPDGIRLAAACGDGTMRVWDTSQAGKPVIEELCVLPTFPSDQHIAAKRGSARAVAFSHSGKLLASGSMFGDVRIWNGGEFMQEVLLLGHESRVTAIAFSSDGNWVLTGAEDHSVRLWDMNGTEHMKQIAEQEIRNVAFGESDNVIFAQDTKGDVLAWDKRRKSRIEHFIAPSSWPMSRQNQDWHALVDDDRVILINLHVNDSREQKIYRKLKQRPKTKWHRESALRSEQSENWFAAMFHWAWAAEEDTLFNVHQELKVTHANWLIEESLDLDTSQRLLPPKVKSALKKLSSVTK